MLVVVLVYKMNICGDGYVVFWFVLDIMLGLVDVEMNIRYSFYFLGVYRYCGIERNST